MFNYKKLLYCGITGLVLAALLHVIIILSLPHFSKNNAWYRISKIFKPYEFHLLNQNPIGDQKEAKITGLNPLFVTTACHFDLRDGVVKIEAKGYAPYWTLSIYNTDSTNLYTLNDQNTAPQHLNVLIATPAQKLLLEKNLTELEEGQILIEVPVTQGLAIFRILRPSDNWQIPVDGFLKSARCNVEIEAEK